jgi:hypothetical protein
MEISIPAKFYCFLATTFLRADIQNCQKTHFLATSCLRKSGITSALIELQSLFYANFKDNKMPFPMTYYTNIFSTVMFSRSSHLTFDLVFLKMRYFNFFFPNILRACNYYLKHLQISSWGCNGIGFYEVFYCKESLHCIDEATSSCKRFCNSDEVSRVIPGKKDYISIKISGAKIHERIRLLCILKEFYSHFKNSYPGVKVGFQNLHPCAPETVLRQVQVVHTVCVMYNSKNVDLMLEAC